MIFEGCSAKCPDRESGSW